MRPVHLSTVRKLLLVEDDADDAFLISRMLRRGGHDHLVVDHVASLTEALATIGTVSDYDAVLLDLLLPDSTDCLCVTRLREIAPEVPIVVLTGADDDVELALSCLQAGAQDYIPKQELDTRSLRRSVSHAIARAQAQSARRQAAELQDRHAALVEASFDAIVSTALDGTVLSWNRGASRIFGVAATEAIGRDVDTVIAAPDGSAATGQLLTTVEPTATWEGERLRHDGTRLALSLAVSLLHDADGHLVERAAIWRDVTALKQRDQMMRALTARQTAIREQERARIAREVHDQLGQLLTGLKMDLRWVGRRLASESPPLAEVVSRLNEVDALVDQTIETVQRIAIEMRPTVLDKLGLPSAMRDEVRRFTSRSTVDVELRLDDDARPGPEQSTALFRILQELLANILRHADATRVEVSLSQDATGYRLSVEDDGRGLPEGVETRSTSLGLLSIRERAEQLGGSANFSSGNADGTRATIRVPRGEE